VNPARNRNAEFLQDLLALIFVNFHALSLRLVELRAMGCGVFRRPVIVSANQEY
jgi:hypothetical protein